MPLSKKQLLRLFYLVYELKANNYPNCSTVAMYMPGADLEDNQNLCCSLWISAQEKSDVAVLLIIPTATGLRNRWRRSAAGQRLSRFGQNSPQRAVSGL